MSETRCRVCILCTAHFTFIHTTDFVHPTEHPSSIGPFSIWAYNCTWQMTSVWWLSSLFQKFTKVKHFYTWNGRGLSFRLLQLTSVRNISLHLTYRCMEWTSQRWHQMFYLRFSLNGKQSRHKFCPTEIKFASKSTFYCAHRCCHLAIHMSMLQQKYLFQLKYC